MEKQNQSISHQFNPYWLEQGYESRFQVFQNLMQIRMHKILLVSSLYDLYLFEEDGRLYELLREEYQHLNLSLAPDITRVSKSEEVFSYLKEGSHFDLIISTPHIEDMPIYDFAKMIRESGVGVPIVLLAYDQAELSELQLHYDLSVFDQVFVWQGDFRLIVGIIKQIEDQLNVDHDTAMVGVQSIILIEDQVRYYSSYLPIIYTELFKQSQRLLSEGVNLSHKFLRMRARPKILLSTDYEEALSYFSRYKDHILGVISDVDYMHGGQQDPEAGLKFAAMVKKEHSDIPILLQSTDPDNQQKAYAVGAGFALKGSRTLLKDLRKFMLDNFGFGDFVFRTPDEKEVGRAHNLRTLQEQLEKVPVSSIEYHAERNHFSSWLKARTEFGLADKLRPRKISDFESIEGLRKSLIDSLNEYRQIRQRGIITDFDKDTFYPLTSFSRIGGGSLGGKARGLSFLNKLIYNYKIFNKFKGVEISVPPAIALGSQVFDEFLEENDLHHYALNEKDDCELTRRFIEADRFPLDVLKQLSEFLQVVQFPLAVRSSSLLEDSQYYPFAGVYDTYMLPNNHADINVRLYDVLNAIKGVYASTFYKSAKEYFEITPHRLEEEKMAVVIQKMVGTQHDSRFYPEIAGVAKSFNFYPIGPQKSTDGIASIAFGLGKTVVEGGVTLKFCPKYPGLIPQFTTVEETLKNSQQSFFALNLAGRFDGLGETEEALLQKLNLYTAEKDNSLRYVGSTYSHENHVIYDGISRPGSRIVTFAPILKHKLFPLPDILELLLDIGSWAMAASVEIEFAVQMSQKKDEPHHFYLLQMRPLVLRHDVEAFDIEDCAPETLLCQSNTVMGNGVVSDISDIIFVDVDRFDRLQTRAVAEEIRQLNAELRSQNRFYLLIGFGRWGTLDPFLGIPVKWEHISNARIIIEAGLKDMCVLPSQGSHFFHNITSFQIGYFTIKDESKNDFVDWDWLMKQQPVKKLKYARHIRLDAPLSAKMNGRESKGIITKAG